jgi:hypothetical protein
LQQRRADEQQTTRIDGYPNRPRACAKSERQRNPGQTPDGRKADPTNHDGNDDDDNKQQNLDTPPPPPPRQPHRPGLQTGFSYTEIRPTYFFLIPTSIRDHLCDLRLGYDDTAELARKQGSKQAKDHNPLRRYHDADTTTTTACAAAADTDDDDDDNSPPL